MQDFVVGDRDRGMIRAYAKVNLDLRVLGVRADGYHELRTVYQTIALHDTIECVPSEGPFAIACEAEGVPGDRSNLVWRAAEALWRAVGRPGPLRGVRIRIDKRIPLQAGLGGGSADAAAALTGLARLWGVDDRIALGSVAAEVGADVPFFLTGGTAIGTGRGDEIRPLADLPHAWIVLLVPSFGISSADAYRWYDGEVAAGRAAAGRAPLAAEGPPDEALMANDLEAPVVRRHPEIARMTGALRGAGARRAAMTGSGSTVFGLFHERAAAAAAADRLSGSPWRVLLTESVGRAEYERRGT